MYACRGGKQSKKCGETVYESRATERCCGGDFGQGSGLSSLENGSHSLSAVRSPARSYWPFYKEDCTLYGA